MLCVVQRAWAIGCRPGRRWPAAVVARNRGAAASRPPHIDRHLCPGCQRPIRDTTFRQHLRLCCPDALAHVLLSGAWPGSAAAAASLGVREAALLEAAVELRYLAPARATAGRDAGADNGAPSSADRAAFAASELARVGAALGVPPSRVAGLLARASAAVPLVADPAELDVVFEDDHLLVCAKPAGLRAQPIHRFQGNSLVNRGVSHLNGRVPYVVHRLDLDTSGVMLFAKSSAVAGGAAAQFRAGSVIKEYLALAAGVPLYDCWTVTAPLGAHPDPAFKERRAVSPEGDATALPASTSFRVLATAGGACLLRCEPATGRTHQIRLHAGHSGLPLLGDAQYGPGRWGRDPGAGCDHDDAGPAATTVLASGLCRQALHAARLTLTHPGTGQTMSFAAPLPPDLAAATAALGLPSSALDRFWSDAGMTDRDDDATARRQSPWPTLGAREWTRGAEQ